MAARRMEMMDGNQAAASVAHKVSEVIAIYPITPSSPMGEFADDWSAVGQKNIWGSVPLVQEMQSKDAARVLASGQLPGATGKTFAFMNPHLAGLDSARVDLLRVQHERLFDATKVIMLNMAIGSVEAAARRLAELAK